MSMTKPLWYYYEHTDVTMDCPPFYLSSSVDCDVLFFLGRTSTKTRRMPWTCRVGKANTSWDSRVSKTKVVRPLTSSFSLDEVTSLIPPIQSGWTETHTKMLFCTDMYPATVLFRTCEQCVRTAAAAWLRCPLLLPSQPPIVLPATTADVGAATAARKHAPLHAASVAAMKRAVRPPPLLSAPRHRWKRMRGGRQGTYLSLPPHHRPQHCAGAQHLSGGFAERQRPPLSHPARLPPAGRPPPAVGQACLIRAWYHGGGGGGASVPVDWAVATAADGDEAHPHPFTDAEKAAAAAPAPASSSTEAPAAWRSSVSVEAVIAPAAATGATIMLPPAGATRARC